MLAFSHRAFRNREAAEIVGRMVWHTALSVIALSGIVRRLNLLLAGWCPADFQSSRFQES